MVSIFAANIMETNSPNITTEGNFTLVYHPSDSNAEPHTALEAGIQFLYDCWNSNWPHTDEERLQYLNRYNDTRRPLSEKVGKRLQRIIDEVLQPAFEEGNQDATYWLFVAYNVGLGAEKDEDKALEYLKTLAECGYIDMQWELASMCQCYYWDNRKREMQREAVKWYEKLAKLGEEEAMYRLGECFSDKSSGKRSCRKSFLWYKRAAERGHKEAMEELGFCYRRGIGTKKDLATAAEWYEKAGMHDKAERLRKGEDDFAFDVFPSHPIPYMEEVDGLIPFPEKDMDNPF